MTLGLNGESIRTSLLSVIAESSDFKTEKTFSKPMTPLPFLDKTGNIRLFMPKSTFKDGCVEGREPNGDNDAARNKIQQI